MKNIVLKNIAVAFALCMMLAQCQDPNRPNMNNLPEYNVQICHPSNDYLVEFVSDEIRTLEGVPAGLPYGGTSGNWGDSGAGFTEQHGTPIGADIVYYSKYEDTYYHLDANFPIDKMKDFAKRAYAVDYANMYKKPLEEYIISDKRLSFSGSVNPYSSMTDLVFGFAPKGMVVVWVAYLGSFQIEVGRYQAKPIEEDDKLKRWFAEKFSVSKEELRRTRLIDDASPKKWDDYRTRYPWKISISSENPTFRMLQYDSYYYNGEREAKIGKWLDNSQLLKDRALPKELNFYWRTGAKGNKESFETIECRVFFDWDTTNEIFKNAQTPINLDFKVSNDNNTLEVFLNGKAFKPQSIRIYSTDVFDDEDER